MEGEHEVEPVRIRIELSGPGDVGEDTRDLCAWLRRTLNSREHASVRLLPDPPGGADPTDGAAADARTEADGAAYGPVEGIDLALGHGFAALNLAMSYASWRAARPTSPAVTLTGRHGSVTVHDGSAEDIRRIVTALEGNAPTGGGHRP
ncbi:effector-associated constant component EACC1 [Streptomyces phytohabitans]|uniref:effector-associated constant component EACC1 n=1 Tax=Streptomyces phytohabitans TaxID=1150371 RepID=UPI00345BE77B